MTTYIEELGNVIRRLHGVDSAHVESIPVKETFQGETVWDGVVEVFDLKGHPTSFRAYAWAHDTEDADKRRYVAVLHEHPIKSAQDAVKAALIQEYRSLAPEES